MMKPYEETWLLEDTRDDGICHIVTAPKREAVLISTARQQDRARLAAAAPELVRVLLTVEWITTGYDYHEECPTCVRDKGSPADHAPDCALDLALRKAGAR